MSEQMNPAKMITRRSDPGQPGKVLTCFSTSSAVGKTTVAVNAAAYIAAQGYAVCLVDLDLQFGDVSRYLHLEPATTLYDFAAASDVSKAATDFVVRSPYGFDVLSCPREIDEAWAIETGAAAKAVNQLRLAYDYVLLDTSTGFSPLNSTLLEQTDILYLLFVIDFIPSVKNLKLGLDTLRELAFNQSRLRLVLNRSDAATQIGVEDVESISGRPFDYIITNDYQTIIGSLRSGKPAILSEPRGKAAAEIAAMLAHELGGAAEKTGGIKSWFGKLWG